MAFLQCESDGDESKKLTNESFLGIHRGLKASAHTIWVKTILLSKLLLLHNSGQEITKNIFFSQIRVGLHKCSQCRSSLSTLPVGEDTSSQVRNWFKIRNWIVNILVTLRSKKFLAENCLFLLVLDSRRLLKCKSVERSPSISVR